MIYKYYYRTKQTFILTNGVYMHLENNFTSIVLQLQLQVEEISQEFKTMLEVEQEKRDFEMALRIAQVRFLLRKSTE